MEHIVIKVQSPVAVNNTTAKGHLTVVGADGDTDSNTNDG